MDRQARVMIHSRCVNTATGGLLFVNKLNIIIKKIDSEYIKNNYDELVASLYEERRNTVKRLKLEGPRIVSISAGLLLQEVIKEELNIDTNDLQFKKGENGKPKLEGYDFHFNLSHSGEYVVIVYGAQEVGIDIERIKDNNLSVAKRCFLEAENGYINSDARRFTQIWTMKESYLKLTGEGISVPLNSFEVDIDNMCVKATDYQYSMKELEDYIICVCSKGEYDICYSMHN